MNLPWIDIVILVIVGVSALLGLFRGLVREVISLVGWVVSGWLAFKFSGPVAHHLANFVSLPSARMALAFIGLLLSSLLVFGIIGFLVGKLIDSTGLTGTDRMLGVILGFARGLAVVTVLVILAGLTPVPRDPWWHQSRFIGHLEQLAQLAISWLPPNFAKHFSYESQVITVSPSPAPATAPATSNSP
jgi:membrane protein required for colicin V production